MCHSRSLGTVAHLKDEGCENEGSRIESTGWMSHGSCKMRYVISLLHMLSYGQQGGGGCDNVFDEYNTGP